jgi:hypothetical protein
MGGLGQFNFRWAQARHICSWLVDFLLGFPFCTPSYYETYLEKTLDGA